MDKEIINDIVELLGKPTKKVEDNETVNLIYKSVGKCDMTFLISQNKFAFFLSDIGPIIEDDNVENLGEMKAIFKEIKVTLRHPITEINYVIDGRIEKTLLKYIGLVDEDATELIYTGGLISFFKLLKKRVLKVIVYSPWI
jgi:hypothetical protein